MKSLSKENVRQLGLQAFAAWLGDPDTKSFRWDSESWELLERAARGLFQFPDADAKSTESATPWADEIFLKLAERHQRKPAPFWPGGRPYALLVTHDIDRVLSTYQRFARAPFTREGWKWLWDDLSTSLHRESWAENPFFNFGEVQAWSKRNGVRSTFFVLFERVRWWRALTKAEPQHVLGIYSPKAIANELRELEEDGHEIGLHASFDAWKEATELGNEIHAVEMLGLKRPIGVRNHYLNFDFDLTPAVQQSNRLIYDSTIGFNYQCGFRAGTCFPYRLGGTWELPFQLMDSALRFSHSTAASFQLIAQETLSRVRSVGGMLVVNWHLHVLNEATFPREMGALNSIVETAQRDGAWITTGRELVEWWQMRASSRRASKETRGSHVSK